MTDQEKIPESIFVTSYFVLLGAGTTVGWNALLNSLDYFTEKYPTSHIDFLVPIAIYLGQSTACLSVTRLSSIFSFNLRIIGSLSLTAPILILLPVEASIYEGTTLGLALFLLLLLIIGFCSAMCSASLVGIASQLSSKYMSCFFIGTTMVALVMSFFREISTYLFQSSKYGKDTSVIIYFALAMSLILTCIAVQPKFSRSDIYHQHCLTAAKVRVGEPDNKQALKEDASGQGQLKRNFRTLIAIFQEIKFYAVLLIIVCVQFHTVYPGVMLAKPIENLSSEAKVVSMVLTFSLMQAVGKVLGQFKKYYSGRLVLFITILRFGLIGVFIAQTKVTDDSVLASTWFAYVNIALFGLTTGFGVVALCVLGPEKVQPKKREIAGYVSVLSMNVGDPCWSIPCITTCSIK